MKNRLRLIRKDAQMTQAEFASKLGVGRDAVASYELGRVVPNTAYLMLISREFNVRLEWLENGEGTPYKEGLIPQLVRALRNAPALQAGLERLLDVMDDEDWRILNEVVRKAMQNENSPEP